MTTRVGLEKNPVYKPIREQVAGRAVVTQVPADEIKAALYQPELVSSQLILDRYYGTSDFQALSSRLIAVDSARNSAKASRQASQILQQDQIAAAGYGTTASAATAASVIAPGALYQLPPDLMEASKAAVGAPKSLEQQLAEIDAELQLKQAQIREEEARVLATRTPEGMLETLAAAGKRNPPTITPDEAANMMQADPATKLKMLESWGMKPKHTNKDPEGALKLFDEVVSSMTKGPGGMTKMKFAGKKFKWHIKLGPDGQLTAGFKRKKPSFLKKLLKVVLKVAQVALTVVGTVVGGVGGMVMRAISMASNFIKT